MDETIYVIFRVQFDFALEVWFGICFGCSKEQSRRKFFAIFHSYLDGKIHAVLLSACFLL